MNNDLKNVSSSSGIVNSENVRLDEQHVELIKDAQHCLEQLLRQLEEKITSGLTAGS
jgi:hypothetical protein